MFPVSAFGSKTPFFPGLNAPTEAVVSYFSTHTHAVLICAFLQSGAAIPFGIFAATVASRLHFLGVKAAGVSIAFFGGAMAAINELNSGAVIFVRGKSLVAQKAALVQAFHYLAVALGGPGFTMPFGLLMAGVCTTAGFSLNSCPNGSWHSACSSLLPASWLSLVIPQAAFLIPFTRWLGFVWLIVAGFNLPKTTAANAIAGTEGS